MRTELRAALIYAVWLDQYRDVVFGDEFSAAGLDDGYYPGEDWPLQHLDPDSRWFDRDGEPGVQTRADAIARAMERAVDVIESDGYETYGDYHQLSINHPFGLEFLNYPELPADGSSRTVFNIGDDGTTGSSWRMIASFDGPSYSVIPGGNSGDYFSPHYADQLSLWLNGEYKPMSLEITGAEAYRFEGTE
jgi:penicillin amidase